MLSTATNMHPSGLNIIQNEDGSYTFEWNKNDARWNWMNGMSDAQIRDTIQRAVMEKSILEELSSEEYNIDTSPKQYYLEP